MAAYVEIIFDNSDGRFSIETDEVILRRTVGHKKDEFFLNRKRIQKNEVQSLLESAGFSKSNPYYIVQQGKVANLCVMKDKDRLKLLKEVAGTTVYEERRAESIKIMQDAASKQEKIEEVLAFIEERLTELEQEKQELSEFEQLDKKRKVLEYSLYDKEYSKAKEQMRGIEALREEERDQQQRIFGELRELQDRLSLEDDAIVALQSAVERLRSQRDVKKKELAACQALRSAVEVQLQEASAAVKANEQETRELRVQLREVVEAMESREEEFAAGEKEFMELTMTLEEKQEQMGHLKNRIEALYGKQGRGAQFSTREERDSFLETKISSLRALIDERKLTQTNLGKEIRADDKLLQTERSKLQQLENESKSKEERFESLSGMIQECTQRKNSLQEQRQSRWRELELLQEQVQEMQQELDRGKQQLSRALPRHITQGLAAVESIVQERQLEGYYGPLIDNISLRSERLQTAVETAAGNALFHIVVEDDTVAATLMKELERRKAGRLTFLPLNRLRDPKIKYPDSTDVRPLMEVALEYEPHFDLAVKQVFGHKLLARDLEVAAHYSRESELDAITEEGDVVNRKGGFEGGFHDDRSSRFGAVMQIRKCSHSLSELLEKEAEIKAAAEEAFDLINAAGKELQQHATEREHLRVTLESMSNEVASGLNQLSAAVVEIEERRKGLKALQSEMSLIVEQVESYQQEQQSPLTEKLSKKERNELQKLEGQVQELQLEVEALEAQVMAASTVRVRLRTDIQNNLLKRRTDIEHHLARLTAEGRAGGRGVEPSQDGTGKDLQGLQLEQQHEAALYQAIQKELKEVEEQLRGKSAEMEAIESALGDQRSQEQQLQNQLAESTKTLDKLLNKRALQLETIQSRQHLLRDLGTVARSELEGLKNSSEKQLMHQLKGVNERLKEYAGVNRKALEQYVSFNEQRETLLERKDEMDRDGVAIQQLIDSLDAQKDEAILRTFNGVSEHFSEVFRELCPEGSGEMVMQTTLDGAEGEQGSVEQGSSSSAGVALQKEGGSPPSAVSTFTGVQIRVSFSGAGQQFQMQQLSGGQKALVALALIFAIQRCDPAPFYLFDEIDQALDGNYRAGVARLIQQQVESDSAPAQFITTTFRPEFVSVAEKCYGIALVNKVSNIYPLDKEDAQNFVTNLMLEEEAVGQVTSTPSLSRAHRLEELEPDEDDDEEDNNEDNLEDNEEEGEEEEKTSSRRKMRRLTQKDEEEEDSDLINE